MGNVKLIIILGTSRPLRYQSFKLLKLPWSYGISLKNPRASNYQMSYIFYIKTLLRYSHFVRESTEHPGLIIRSFGVFLMLTRSIRWKTGVALNWYDMNMRRHSNVWGEVNAITAITRHEKSIPTLLMPSETDDPAGLEADLKPCTLHHMVKRTPTDHAKSLRPRKIGRHFADDIFCWELTIFCFQGSNQQYSSIRSDNDLVPNRRQVIIWTEQSTDAYMRHSASMTWTCTDQIAVSI